MATYQYPLPSNPERFEYLLLSNAPAGLITTIEWEDPFTIHTSRDLTVQEQDQITNLLGSFDPNEPTPDEVANANAVAAYGRVRAALDTIDAMTSVAELKAVLKDIVVVVARRLNS